MKSIFALLIFTLLSTLAAAASVTTGYVQDVQKEKDEKFYEVFLFAEPAVKEKPLSEIIFNQALSKEFKNRYRERFGTIDTESIAYQRNDFERLEAFRATKAAEANSSERRRFADYMIKRLAEWHIDNYIKSEPSMRPVYQLKERLKKVEVRVDKQTKFEGRYSLAENVLDILIENKYLDETRLSLDFEKRDTQLVVGQPLTSSVRLRSSWWEREGRGNLEWIKALTANLSTSYGLSAAYKAGGTTPRDTRLAFSFGYRF